MQRSMMRFVRTHAVAAGSVAVATVGGLALGGMVLAGSAGAVAGAPAHIDRGLQINGVFVDKVKLDGKMMTQAQFDAASVALQAKGTAVYVYVEGYMSKTGYTLATTSVRQQNAWIAASPRPQIVKRSSQATAPLVKSAASGVDCSVYWNNDPNQTAIYTGSNCTSNLQLLVPGHSYATVTYNDAYSSLQEGCKMSSVTVWEDVNFPAGKSYYFGNGGGSTYGFSGRSWPNGRGLDNSVGSITTSASGASC